MDKKITNLYNGYKNGQASRREFIRKLVVLTGSTAAAMALVPVLEDNTLSAEERHEAIQNVLSEYITYPAETGEMRGYLSKPGGGGKFPAVVVIHENRGLVPHIRDVNERMAKEGFLSLAPDALSPVGGTPENGENVRELFGKLDSEQTTKNFVAAVKYLKTHPDSNGKVGCTGFYWGGGVTNQVAVNCPGLDAAVPYYGRQPSAEDVAKIEAPLMAHYGGNDERINAGIPAFEEALKKNNKEYQFFIYPGAEHAFNNDTNEARYHKEAAALAWERTIKFLKEKLKT